MTKVQASPAPMAFAILLAAPLWLTACHETTDPRNRSETINTTANGTDAGAVSKTPLPVANRAEPNSGKDAGSSTAPRIDPVAMKGEAGARIVLNDWAQALERRDWAAARAQWGHGGADSGLDRDAFINAYEKYASVTVTIGDGDVDGAAGSLYYEVPVTLTGKLLDGRSFRLEGPVTLRRVNDVEGATAQELAWHISQSDLKPRE